MKISYDDRLNKIKACILGHAIGDAVGVPVEFFSREELQDNPVTNMRGFGTYPFPAGCWSDDTSMTLAALDSLAKGSIDFDEIMINFGKWYYKDEFTPTGEMFDVGNTCSLAIDSYFVNHLPIGKCGLSNERSNGNGSLMRIIPFALFLEYAIGDIPFQEKIHYIHEASALTHAHERSKIACGIYFIVLSELLSNPCKESIHLAFKRAEESYRGYQEIEHFSRLFSRNFEKLDCIEIKSYGYVVDTLEAAIWSLLTTASYKECILKAVNLGEDTDTVAAVAGGLAGALYGYDEIPLEWLSILKRRNYIEELCNKADSVWRKNS